MEKHTQYWDEELTRHTSLNMLLEARAIYAWELIKSHPNVAGIQDGEDPTGRSRLRLQTPKELVERSLEISDLYFSAIEARGEIKPTTITLEERSAKMGELEFIRSEGSYRPRNDRALTAKS